MMLKSKCKHLGIKGCHQERRCVMYLKHMEHVRHMAKDRDWSQLTTCEDANVQNC
jgi:hypothetical protein